jgi:acyl-CoA hydrolase
VDNLIAINMDLEVDFMGQLTAETVNGNRIVGTTGGQLDFVIGSAWSKGGRAINVLPSTRTLNSGEKVSTIVPGFAPGTHVTIPHMYTQFVVTEYGIADLWLKTRRERAEALISIAHPDFRTELRKEAMKRLY